MSPKKKPIKPAGPVPKKAKVKCKICGKPLGYMSQVRKYGQSHFLIMDGTLHEKVKAYPDPGFMKPMDGRYRTTHWWFLCLYVLQFGGF